MSADEREGWQAVRVSEEVRLRRVRRDDLAWLAEMVADPIRSGEHNWPGGEPRPVDEVHAELRAEFGDEAAFGTRLVVEFGDDGLAPVPIGDVSWRIERWGPSARSRCPAFGITLLPEFRGRGLGTAAQRLLIDHLFRSDPDLHRVQSDTAVDNLAELRALDKIGMVREGTIRDAEYRGGRFHDHVVFSILRSEWQP